MYLLLSERSNQAENERFVAATNIFSLSEASKLSKPEQEELEKIGLSGRKAEFLSLRLLVRWMLKECLGAHDEIKILKDGKGKPYGLLGNKNLSLSFAHADEYAVCALSTSGAVGVDIEHISRNPDSNIQSRMLSAGEEILLGDVQPIQLWTMKEAAAKCAGTGLGFGLKNILITKKLNGEFVASMSGYPDFQLRLLYFKNHHITLAFTE